MKFRTVRVVAYDPAWHERFAAEERLIRKALGDAVVAIHHIGSTAVPGLAAKPIIDIMPEVTSLAAVDARSRDMEALGYSARGEMGIPGRRYFCKEADGERTHHVHAFVAGDEHAVRHLAFRDYLREHRGARDAYADLKRRLAAECDNDIDRYMDGKDGFIKRHEALALEWYRSAR